MTDWTESDYAKKRRFGRWDFKRFDQDTYEGVVGLICRIGQIIGTYPDKIPAKQDATTAVWQVDALLIIVGWKGGQVAVSFAWEVIRNTTPESQRVFREVTALLEQAGAEPLSQPVYDA